MSNTPNELTSSNKVNGDSIVTIIIFVVGIALYFLPDYPKQNEYVRIPFSIGVILFAGLCSMFVRNELVKFREKIRSSKAVFESSAQRKKKLQANLINLAETLSNDEANIHHSIVSELKNAVSEIGQGGLPSFVLANLAARFPNLNNVAGFTSAQRSAIEIESKIDVDMREVNEHIRVYNEIIHLFPTNIVSFFIGFRVARYVTIEGYGPQRT